jgi:Tfp pilus assembly protein PilF
MTKVFAFPTFGGLESDRSTIQADYDEALLQKNMPKPALAKSAPEPTLDPDLAVAQARGHLEAMRQRDKPAPEQLALRARIREELERRSAFARGASSFQKHFDKLKSEGRGL